MKKIHISTLCTHIYIFICIYSWSTYLYMHVYKYLCACTRTHIYVLRLSFSWLSAASKQLVLRDAVPIGSYHLFGPSKQSAQGGERIECKRNCKILGKGFLMVNSYNSYWLGSAPCRTILIRSLEQRMLLKQ